MWAQEVLLLFRCSVKEENDRRKLAFRRYIECVGSLDEKVEALKCVCLQWAALGSGKEYENLDEGRT